MCIKKKKKRTSSSLDCVSISINQSHLSSIYKQSEKLTGHSRDVGLGSGCCCVDRVARGYIQVGDVLPDVVDGYQLVHHRDQNSGVPGGGAGRVDLLRPGVTARCAAAWNSARGGRSG